MFQLSGIQEKLNANTVRGCSQEKGRNNQSCWSLQLQPKMSELVGLSLKMFKRNVESIVSFARKAEKKNQMSMKDQLIDCSIRRYWDSSNYKSFQEKGAL